MENETILVNEGDDAQADDGEGRRAGTILGAGKLLLYRENVGNFWARNQHITHLFPKSCQ